MPECFGIINQEEVQMCLHYILLETESAILKRLAATKRLVQHLFNEVASLKAQDITHKMQIVGLKKQLHWQRQRNSHLGKLNSISTSKLKTRSLEVSNKNPEHVETKHCESISCFID
jgi:hypothetical protein